MVLVSFGIGLKLRPIFSFGFGIGPKPNRWFWLYNSPGSTWTLSIIWIQSVLGDEAKGFLCNKGASDYCCIFGMCSYYSF